MNGYVNKVIPMYMGEVGFKYNKQFLKVFSYLIFTEKHLYLYDTGLNRLFVENEKKILQDLSTFMIVDVNEQELLEEKLKVFGKSIKQIKGVICSHLHFDHAGGLNYFKNIEIPVYLDKNEYEEAFKTKRSFEYKKEDFGFLENKKNIVFVKGKQFVNKNECIQIIPTPGHSAGHLSLLLIGKTKKMLLTGDAVYTRNNLKERKATSFPYEKRKAEESIDILQELEKQCDYVICGHDCDEYADCELIL